MIAPETEAELSDFIVSAKGRIRIVGGGTRSRIQAVDGAAELRTSGLSGITLYEPAALALVVKAGTTLAEIDGALDTNNQRLAFEPTDLRGLLGTAGDSTIGGIVACNASGPRRVQAGACRDFLTGIRFVDGMGNVIKSGGRVMKNVTGLDLAKLLAGSFGTLGVISEVAFKVLPKPEKLADLVLAGLTDEMAVAALAAALGSPFDVSGAAHLPGRRQTLVRLEGFAASVVYRAGKLRDVLAPFGEAEIRTNVTVAKTWQQIRDVSDFAAKPGAVWRVSLKPSSGPRLVAELQAAGQASDAIYDWGGGLVWLLVPDTADALAATIRAALGRLGGGHATLVRPGAATDPGLAMFQPEPAGIARLTAGLRQKFDPRGIFATRDSGAVHP